MFFKFQSDSINTEADGPVEHVEVYFKFQSDSINTLLWSREGRWLHAL